WLRVETGKLRPTKNTSPNRMALSLTHRPQVMGLACVELEKSFIAETDISCLQINRPSNQFPAGALSGTKFSAQCRARGRPWICCLRALVRRAECAAVPYLPGTKEEFCPEGRWCGPSGVRAPRPPRRFHRTSKKSPAVPSGFPVHARCRATLRW